MAAVRFPNPAVTYAENPERTYSGAQSILATLLRYSITASDLSRMLNGESENAKGDRETLEMIDLRLKEAVILSRRLSS